jgi:ABC-type Zn2+ transport system substrate-binding protein/surface adhesin
MRKMHNLLHEDDIADKDIDYSDIPKLRKNPVIIWRGPIQGYVDKLLREHKEKERMSQVASQNK